MVVPAASSARLGQKVAPVITEMAITAEGFQQLDLKDAVQREAAGGHSEGQGADPQAGARNETVVDLDELS